MAGVSTKEIKNRIRSMESTRQITKAMEMVASSKLRRAQNQVNNSRPYFETLYSAIHDIADSSAELESVYMQARPVKKALFVVIAGDRGLAGGYNSNILKLCHSAMADKDVSVLPIGRKSAEFFKLRQIPILTEAHTHAELMTVGDCFTVAKQLCKVYKAGEVDAIYVGYTHFASVLSQTPTTLQMLPIRRQTTGKEGRTAGDILYEPNAEAVLETIVPEYLGGILYGALCESRASEQAARRTAMDAATSNADEMIADLSLKFNRARQAAITQEITEIVAGG